MAGIRASSTKVIVARPVPAVVAGLRNWIAASAFPFHKSVAPTTSTARVRKVIPASGRRFIFFAMSMLRI
jgi:hypothetical protein